jgi:hypothetical protein
VTDLDHDPLEGAFDDLRGQVAPFVRPAGASRTRETVRTRKRNHTIVLSVLAVLVIAVPAAITATLIGDPHRTQPSSVLSLGDLNRAKLDVPAWPSDKTAKGCPEGVVQFTPMIDTSKTRPVDHVDTVIYADVNNDGRKETIAWITCLSPTKFHTNQVVAFDRDKKGTIRTLGRVVARTGGIADLCYLRNGPGNTVEVMVNAYSTQCWQQIAGQWQPAYVTQQWRTFSWNGKAFVQSGGPTSFPSNPYVADLAISNSDLILTRQADGHYHGSMTVTVRNHGPGSVPFVTMTWVTSDMHATVSEGFRAESDPYGGGMAAIRINGTVIPAGATRTATLTFDAAKRDDAFDFDPGSNVASPGGYGDPNTTNDQVGLTIKFQG